MSAFLKLQPTSALASETKSIHFTVSGLISTRRQRISLENITFSTNCKFSNGEQYIYVEPGNAQVFGTVDLLLPEDASGEVVSIYANIEQENGDSWAIKDIAAFAFQVRREGEKVSDSKVSVYPPFVSPNDTALIEISTEPNERLKVLINGKGFIVRSNSEGKGTMHIRGIDLMSGSSFSAGSMQKFPVTYAKGSEKFQVFYDSESNVHYVPETMRVLQATNEPDGPECAIIDPEPPPGLRLQTLDDFCFDGAVVGETSVFDSGSSYVNSRIGYCSNISETSVEPTNTSGICRIYNGIDAGILPNGTSLAVFASAFDPSVDAVIEDIPILSSRIYVAHAPSSLKFDGNPVRNGSILEPKRFYHSWTLESEGSGGYVGILFRLDTGELIEIRHDYDNDSSGLGSIDNIVSQIRASALLTGFGIEVFALDNRIDVFSDSRFSIRATQSGGGSASAKLNSNRTLEILVSDDNALQDEGSTVVFLEPQLGSQTYSVVGQSLPSVLRVDIPEGVNNGIGPTIAETLYCQKFVIIGSDSPSTEGISEVNPLPYVRDVFSREVPASNPTIAIVPDRISGNSYCYVICQAPVNGIYQLFYFGFALGETVDQDPDWKQLTFVGENKNPIAECDATGNVHIVWESDRDGDVSQVYYGILGPGSRITSNRAFMSAIEKEINNDAFSGNLLNIGTPVAHQLGFLRLLENTGGVSIPTSTLILLDGSPANDGAIAFYKLDANEDGKEFNGQFSQLSYQVSFNLEIRNVQNQGFPELSDDDIEKLFVDFKSQFSKSVGDRYVKENNTFTLDKFDKFYDKIIPLVGSYDIGERWDDLSNIIPGGTDARHAGGGVNFQLVLPEFNGIVAANDGANLQHYMLVALPEKIRFKALNIDPLFTYLEKNELTAEAAETYIPQIEETVYTGRYKLAVILATSEDESTGDAASQKYHILRQFGEPMTFDNNQNHEIKIAVHYSKANQDYIDGKLKINPYASEQDARFNADLIVTIDNKIALGESFIADFADQYKDFDIGFGLPPGSQIETQEILPFNGNQYDDNEIILNFFNVAIGPHSISPNPEYVSFSSYDRNTQQMFVPETVQDLLLNGDFEDNSIPISPVVSLVSGDESLTQWTIGNQINIGNADSDFISYSGSYSVALTGLDDSSLGFIEQTIVTEIGKTYLIQFALSSDPGAADALGTTVVRKVEVKATSNSMAVDEEQTFTTTISPDDGNDQTDADEQKWVIHSLQFTASSVSTTIRFSNVSDSQSPFANFGPIIDGLKVLDLSLIPDELLSRSASEELDISEDEYRLNFHLSTFGDFSQVPITVSSDYQNRNPDLTVDAMNKAHVVWQSNRNGYWDIYYAGMRDNLIPFRFDTRITSTQDDSLEPSIAADSAGRRVIVWHDDRKNRYHQIYAAINKIPDPLNINQCRIDMVDEYIYQREQSLDPYDPYLDSVPEALTCRAEFVFEAEESGIFYFVLDLYSDREKQNLVKSIDSRESILGWKVNGAQMSSGGASVSIGQSVNVSYTVSKEDGLGNAIYYVDVKYESDTITTGSVTGVNNIVEVNPSIGQSLIAGDYENASPYYFLERANVQAGFSQTPQTASTILSSVADTGASPTIAIDGSGQLEGFSEDDVVTSYFVQYDPVGDPGTSSQTFTLQFDSPIVAVYVAKSELLSSQETLNRAGLVYPGASDLNGSMDSNSESIAISADKKSIQITFLASGAEIDDMRIVLKPLAETSGSEEFVYHCAYDQSARCAVEAKYYNLTSLEQNNVHFRINFYADSDLNSLILSRFSYFDLDGWIYDATGFPATGATIEGNGSINIGFDPEVLPFEKFQDQSGEDQQTLANFFTFGPDNWITESMLGSASESSWTADESNGAIFYEDDDVGNEGFFLASPKYSGNLSKWLGGIARFYMKLDENFNATLNPRTLKMQITTRLGSFLEYDTGVIPTRSDSFTLFSVPLENGPGWTYNGGPATDEEFLATLSDVEFVKISSDYHDETDKVYMGSFEFVPPAFNTQPRTFEKPLICGATYYYKIERFYEQAFTTIEIGQFICPCFDADANIWREDKDSQNWICSGQGFDDFRITQTDREALNPRVVSAHNDLFYISWEDYRFSRMQSGQPVISPDYFFGVYNSAEDKFYSSAQGSYDRRMTFYADQSGANGLILFDHVSLIDPYQNINILFHDGVKTYHQACSIGCAYVPFNPERITPCKFTDGTDDDFYQVTTGPERNIEQYQKMRIREDYVQYSTYLDADSPIPVVNDCFIELDIIGVPGTYAYRLKNEEDDEFSEWMPIGPNIAEQNNDSAEALAERDFFRGYFISKDRFIAPWIVSPGNGSKRVCCEILTYFGKTSQFCLDFQAVYKELGYRVDFFYDESFESSVPDYKSYPVVGLKETETPITEENLQSISEEVSSETINTIYIRVTFSDPQRLVLLERMRGLNRFSYLDDISFSVYQQGLNDQIDLPLTKISDGVYSGSFTVEEDDTVVNVDGLGVVLINVPGQCNPISVDRQNDRLLALLSPQNLDQRISVFNSLSLFIENYNDNDVKNSFGNPSYYKQNRFGVNNQDQEDVGETGGNNQWAGGGDGPLESGE